MTDTIDIEALRVEETFVADAQLLLHEMMLAKGVSRAQLAGRLGVSRARVSQLFSSECKNFTIRLLARAMHALGETPALSCEWARAREERWSTARLAELCADPTTNLVAMWAEDGVVVGPDDRRGDCRSDPRLHALLRTREGAGNDNDRWQAVA